MLSEKRVFIFLLKINNQNFSFERNFLYIGIIIMITHIAYIILVENSNNLTQILSWKIFKFYPQTKCLQLCPCPLLLKNQGSVLNIFFEMKDGLKKIVQCHQLTKYTQFNNYSLIQKIVSLILNHYEISFRVLTLNLLKQITKTEICYII